MKPIVATWCLAAALCAGCCTPPACPQTARSLDEVVDAYNANAAAAPRLWARAKITVKLADALAAFSLDTGNLILSKSDKPLGPHDFVIIGREGGTEVMRLGSSLSEGLWYYWYGAQGKAGGAYGRLDSAGGPNSSGGIDPLQLLAVLCLVEMPPRQVQVPAVIMTLQPGVPGCNDWKEPCAYVLSYIDRQPVTGRILMRRQVYFLWDDKAPARPFRVDFIAPDGRRVMTAELKDYQPVAGTGPAPAMMPTDITISEVAQSGRKTSGVQRIRLQLSEMTADESKVRSAVFDFSRNLKVSPQVLIDADSAGGSPPR
jgi:hypothetical protein